MPDIDSVKDGLQVLSVKFEKDKTHYFSKGYPESQVRIDFLNPLFELLGWDIANTAQKPPHERDVIVEASSEATGRPDYNFRIKGATKFFVEAKSPLTNLSDGKHILQAKSYAWSTKGVFFVILTNYAEFKLFDASLKPNERFPEEGLIYDLKYTEYVSSIDKLWELSKERVEQGSLEALIPKDIKSRRLRIPPDKSFLEDLTNWRAELAKDIHKRNPAFDVKLLNDVVQKILDRIIFIRIAEDRNIRQNRELWEIIARWKGEGRRKPIMADLKNLFYRINDDLNGNIFKAHACEEADIDSALLAEIIENLYAPKSQYRFDAIGVELLGSIYERYLGSTIRVTPQRVKVEEKPEVRKAGGVYYTPEYIVDYIVKNTVGRLIEGKTPRQIEKIRILDPACGSGSFLLGAYQCLIDYHLRYYREHPKQARNLYYDPYYKINPDDITLPIQEKARILKNNIFGVDKDPQAVEITMMSLYLKAIEGERGFLPMRQHLLPPLTYNIICGNSLIGYDMFEGRLFDDGTKDEVNPFDWASKAAGFGEIMESGGFDAVIGNPPYVRIQTMKQTAPDELKYYKKQYASASKGNYDIYVIFVEKGLSLLNNKGRLGFIIPHKFFQSRYGEPLREIISNGRYLHKIVNFNDQQVFDGATTYTCLLFLNKAGSKECFYINVNDISDWLTTGKLISRTISTSDIKANEWNFTIGEKAKLFARLKQMPMKLKDIARIFVGTQTSADEVFVLNNCTASNGIVRGMSMALEKEVEVEENFTYPFLRGKQIRRYVIPATDSRLICPYEITSESCHLLSLSEMSNKFPLALSYLNKNRSALSAREGGKLKGQNWYGFGYPKSMNLFQHPKIIVPDYNNVASFTFDAAGHFYKTGYGVILKDPNISPLYVLALLNSTLLFRYLASISTSLRGGYVRFWNQYIGELPIQFINFNNSSQKVAHDRIVVLVDRMFELHKKANALPPSSERERVEREIALTDEKIDEIVYGLYGITEAEKKIIEE